MPINSDLSVVKKVSASSTTSVGLKVLDGPKHGSGRHVRSRERLWYKGLYE